MLGFFKMCTLFNFPVMHEFPWELSFLGLKMAIIK